MLALPAFDGKQHAPVGGIVRFVAGGAVLRHAVAVVIAVAQPPVMVGHQLRVHLRQPALIAGDAIHFHHRRAAGLGSVALVPVAAVAAALRAGVVGDKVGQKTGVPRAQGVARPDLEGEHCANVVLGHVRVEVRHGVGLFRCPTAGLVAGEPAPGHRRVTESNFIAPAAPRQLPFSVSIALTATRVCSGVACGLLSPVAR